MVDTVPTLGVNRNTTEKAGLGLVSDMCRGVEGSVLDRARQQEE